MVSTNLPYTKVMKHAQVTKARGVLVVSRWASAPFWLMMYPDIAQPGNFVNGVWELPRQELFFVTSLLGSNVLKDHPIHQCWHCCCVSQPACVVDFEGHSLEDWYVRPVMEYSSVVCWHCMASHGGPQPRWLVRMVMGRATA